LGRCDSRRCVEEAAGAAEEEANETIPRHKGRRWTHGRRQERETPPSGPTNMPGRTGAKSMRAPPRAGEQRDQVKWMTPKENPERAFARSGQRASGREGAPRRGDSGDAPPRSSPGHTIPEPSPTGRSAWLRRHGQRNVPPGLPRRPGEGLPAAAPSPPPQQHPQAAETQQRQRGRLGNDHKRPGYYI